MTAFGKRQIAGKIEWNTVPRYA